jgi:hypothetical protein
MPPAWLISTWMITDEILRLSSGDRNVMVILSPYSRGKKVAKTVFQQFKKISNR